MSLLDFGCGSAGLLEHLIATGRTDAFSYVGHDVSRIYVDHCRTAFPDHRFTVGDVLAGAPIDPVDYVIANGVFTERLTLSEAEMFEFMTATVRRLFAAASIGIAFNVMSTIVDWQREDLFHVDPARMIDFVTSDLSRNFQLRHDYPLYEYTVYVYK